MSPEEYVRWFGGIAELTEQQAQQVISAAMRQVGGTTAPEAGTVKVRTIQRVLVDILKTGWPEQPQTAMALRSIRQDITDRLDVAPQGVPSW